MGTEIRQRILEAAARVYAETGYRGATTRRIAQAAGVNEITLFRHFGSKDALLHEAIQCAGQDGAPTKLPEEPRDPEAELIEWCRHTLDHLYAKRSFIRTSMGELEEHPEMVPTAAGGPSCAGRVLHEYLKRLQEGGLAGPNFDPAVASATLIGAMFAEAMTRDVMPQMYPYPSEESPARYVGFFLRAIGARGVDAKPPKARKSTLRKLA
jgi:AcrR family transcriptional regulator